MNRALKNNKVLLINAPYVEGYGALKLAAGRYFPLGLGYIAAVLKQNGFDVRLVDPEAESLGFADLEKMISNWKPLVVGVSSATPNFNNAMKIAKITKNVCHDSIVVIGGIHASALPEFVLLKSADVDVVVIGEGENTMLELCNHAKDGKVSYGDIAGIAYRDGAHAKRTPSRSFITDIDTIPLPARELVNLKLFYPNLFNAKRRVSAGMITSRGCPFKCYFCASHITMGAGYRSHSAKRVYDEIEMLVKKHGVELIIFLDDTFTFDKKRVREICELILKNRLRFEWNCLGRVSDVNEDLLRLMKKAGCYSIAYGVESGDEKTLSTMKKGITIDQIRAAFSLSKKVGLRTQAFFVFGNKGETMEAIDRSIKLAKELNPLIAFFNILTPYPGTKAFEDMGIINNIESIDNWEDFVSIGPKAAFAGKLSKEELTSSVYRANKEFYLRLSQLARIGLSLRTFYEFSQYLKGGLALIAQMAIWKKGR